MLSKIIGENIHRHRKALEITERELGRRLSCSSQSISNWEKGATVPSVEILVKLADYFAVSLDSLVGRTANDTVNVSALTAAQAAHIREIVYDISSQRGNSR